MDSKKVNDQSTIKLGHYLWILIAAWTLTLSLSLFWNIQQKKKTTRALANKEANSFFNKDQAFRFWATTHGGVYVPADKRTPPSPHLKHISDRDIITPSGKKLTLMNPAYMLRQMMDEYSELYHIEGRLVSLKPFRAQNAPDQWEKAALKSFETGKKEAFELTTINSESYLRLLRPMMVKKDCLKCHGYQGYKVGDVRGGLGVSVPMLPYLTFERKEIKQLVISHLLFCFIGVMGIFFGFQKLEHLFKERLQSEKTLRASEENLRITLNSIGDAVIATDTSGNIVRMNPVAETLTGWKLNDTQGKPLGEAFNIVNSKTGEKSENPVSKVLKNGKIIGLANHTILISKDGTEYQIADSAAPIYDTKRDIIGVVLVFRDVTEEYAKEQLINQSEARFKKMIEKSPLPMVITDQNQDISFFNDKFIELFGYTIKDVSTAQEWWEIAYPDEEYRAKVMDSWMAAIETAEANKTDIEMQEWDLTIKDRTKRTCEFYMVPMEKFSLIVMNDITDRKKAEHELRSSKQKLDLHTLQTPLPVIEWDLEFKVRSWNPAAQKVFGYTQEEIIGKHASIITSEIEREQIDTVWTQLLEQKGGIRSTNVNLTKKGDKLFCEWFNTPVVDNTGRVIAVFSLVQNITERLQAEEKLQIERDKLSSVINGIGDSLYIVNRDYVVEFQNNVCLEQFGDLKGEKCFEGFLQQNEPCETCSMQKTLNENCIKLVETDSLNQKSYEITFSPFQENNKEMKCVVLLKDITEKKSLQAEAMRAGHLASLGELAAGVAHEINNPVTGIISIAEILTDKFHDLGGDRKIPERIINEGERIGKIVKNLLSFARDQKEEHNPAHIGEILQLSLDLVEKQIFKDGIQLSINIPSDIPKIKMNRQEIQQVFLNILSNARYAINKKYSNPHKNKVLDITAEVIVIKEEKHVRLSFYDKGIGIPKKFIGKVSDPFYSTKPQGEGTGLGLSISHGIIKNHGGRLWFESREGEYTKVVIDLPIYDG